MRGRLAWIIGSVLVAGIAAVVVYGLVHSPKAEKTSTKSPLSAKEVAQKLGGSPPPLAALHQQANHILPGGRRELRTQLAALRGHPVVVNVWGSWCGPCRVELPLFQKASLDWGKQVGFLGVDSKDSRESGLALLKDIPVTYPSVDDAKAQIFNDYKLIGAPSTVFYDAHGKQTYLHQGQYLDRAALDADIKRYAL